MKNKIRNFIISIQVYILSLWENNFFTNKNSNVYKPLLGYTPFLLLVHIPTLMNFFTECVSKSIINICKRVSFLRSSMHYAIVWHSQMIKFNEMNFNWKLLTTEDGRSCYCSVMYRFFFIYTRYQRSYLFSSLYL